MMVEGLTKSYLGAGKSFWESIIRRNAVSRVLELLNLNGHIPLLILLARTVTKRTKTVVKLFQFILMHWRDLSLSNASQSEYTHVKHK